MTKRCKNCKKSKSTHEQNLFCDMPEMMKKCYICNKRSSQHMIINEYSKFSFSISHSKLYCITELPELNLTSLISYNLSYYSNFHPKTYEALRQ